MNNQSKFVAAVIPTNGLGYGTKGQQTTSLNKIKETKCVK